MKIIGHILATYIIMLSCWPCTDELQLEGDNFRFEELIASDVGHHHNDCPEDDCSPFCICECCHLQMTFCHSCLEIPQVIQLEDTTGLSFCFQHYSNRYSSPLFDPPRFIS